MPERRRGLVGFLRRLTASPNDLHAEQIRGHSRRLGCDPVEALERGDEARVAGRVVTVKITPDATTPSLEAELYDGTASLTLIWLGRRRIPGVEPGRWMLITGRVALGDEDRKVVYNPWYRLGDDEAKTKATKGDDD
ncbi:MAG: DNA-binding protein [Stackebrandtia sp.]